MRTIDTAEALALLNRAVEEKGKDFIYVDEVGGQWNCTYFHGQEPGCIIGHVLSYLDVTREDLLDEPADADYNAMTSFDDPDLHKALRDSSGLAFTHDAMLVLLTAQCEQDRGERWGHALGRAEERVNNR